MMLEAISFVLIGVGLAFDLFGCIGLVRLPDVYNRAQAATKCVTLGTCLILAGVAVLGFVEANWPLAVKGLLCAAFILLTSPVGAHAICRGAYISGVPLWQGSIEDAFADRGRAIRSWQTSEGPAGNEKAEAS